MTASYNENELGWVTDKVLLSKPYLLKIVLEKEGCIIIRKGNNIDGAFPMIYASKEANKEFEIEIDCNGKDVYIYIVTSEEPYSITMTEK